MGFKAHAHQVAF